jgi:hypothetical protein
MDGAVVTLNRSCSTKIHRTMRSARGACGIETLRLPREGPEFDIETSNVLEEPQESIRAIYVLDCFETAPKYRRDFEAFVSGIVKARKTWCIKCCCVGQIYIHEV